MVMLITASVGLCCNFVALFTLHNCGGEDGEKLAHKSVRSVRNLHPGLKGDCGHDHGHGGHGHAHGHGHSHGHEHKHAAVEDK